MSEQKNKEIKIKKDVLQILAERDEGIRQAFSALDQKVAHAVNTLDFKFAVVFTCLQQLGFTENQLQTISQNLHNQVASQMAQGGNHNVQNTSNESAENGGIHNTEGSMPEGIEHGSEHFSRD